MTLEEKLLLLVDVTIAGSPFGGATIAREKGVLFIWAADGKTKYVGANLEEAVDKALLAQRDSLLAAAARAEDDRDRKASHAAELRAAADGLARLT